MAKGYTKHGFSATVNNVDELEKIFDLIENQWRVEEINFRHYFVYNKDAITEEVKALQRKLAKPFWSYKRYNTDIHMKSIQTAFTENEWKKFLQEEEEKKRIAEQKAAARAIRKANEKKRDCYIYGIRIDGELAYIGKTTRPLQERVSEHMSCVLDKTIVNSQQKYLYEAMRNCQGYKFEILYESHNSISNYELEVIEKSFIENMQPKYNYEGVKVPYRFTSEKVK